MANTPKGRLVWDFPTRAFHWLLALSLTASVVTANIGFDMRQYHMWLGYWMIGLLTFRLVWGFVGTRHARFSSFFPTPRRLFTYLKSVVRGGASETVGHNPLGSLMIFATLAAVGLQAVSGLFMDDEIMFAGPYLDSVSPQFASTMSSVHHKLINLIYLLVTIHVAAVLYHVWFRREPLIRAMFSGKKSAEVVPAEQSITSSKPGLALAVAVAVAAFTYGLVTLFPGW